MPRSLLSRLAPVFSRDATTGALGYAQLEYDPHLDGRAGAFGVAPTSDGRHVYVAGPGDDALLVFAPEPGAAVPSIAAGCVLMALARGRRTH